VAVAVAVGVGVSVGVGVQAAAMAVNEVAVMVACCSADGPQAVNARRRKISNR